MKTKFLLLLFLTFVANLEAQITAIANTGSQDKFGLAENEARIKKAFSPHGNSIVEYNIAFFAGAKIIYTDSNLTLEPSLEFWGHGYKYLSIYGPFELDLKGDDIKVFKENIDRLYNRFRSDIVNKKRFYDHIDGPVVDNLILSCYMDRDVPKYAFWYKYSKYDMNNSQFESLRGALNSYYSN